MANDHEERWRVACDEVAMMTASTGVSQNERERLAQHLIDSGDIIKRGDGYVARWAPTP